jgi:hypothetical protein
MSKLTGLKKIRARAGGTRLMAHQVNTDEKAGELWKMMG